MQTQQPIPSVYILLLFDGEQTCKCILFYYFHLPYCNLCKIILYINYNKVATHATLLAKKCINDQEPRKFDAELNAVLVKRLHLSIVFLIGNIPVRSQRCILYPPKQPCSQLCELYKLILILHYSLPHSSYFESHISTGRFGYSHRYAPRPPFHTSSNL